MAGLGLTTPRAHACSVQAPEVYEVDRSLRASDTTAPTPFTAISAEVTRTPGVVCRDGECTASSCGASGHVDLQFAVPRDDREAQLGYRLIWLRGTVPPSLVRELNLVRPLAESFGTAGEGSIGLSIGFDDAATIDAEIALVAVDRAGNESAASEPVRLTFSGCTLALDREGCLEAEGCSVANPGAAPSGPFGFFAYVAIAAVYLRRRRLR